MKTPVMRILENLELYKSNPAIYKNFKSSNKCIVCEHKALEEKEREASLTKSINLSVVNTQINKKNVNLESDFLIWLHKLKIKEYIELSCDSIKQTEQIIDPVEIFCTFSTCFDLTSSSCFITNFNLPIISGIFSSTFPLEHILLNFIEKLQTEAFVYDKPDRDKIIKIEIFVFIWLSKHGMCTKAIKKRIEEHAFALKPDPEYRLELTGDVYVDKMIIQLRKDTLDMDMAIFMNRVYLSVKKDKEYTEIFHKQLLDAIRKRKSADIMIFLKHVFTYNTILFSCIQNEQLVRLILSFYKNINKTEIIISLLSLLYVKVPFITLNQIIFDELSEWCKKSKKHIGTQLLLNIRAVENIRELKTYILINKDSFDALNLLFRQLKLLKDHLKTQSQVIETIEIILEFFIQMKSEFYARFLHSITQMLISLIDSLIFDQELVMFNKLHWDKFSNLLLACHTEQKEEKKKKNDKIGKEPDSIGIKLAKSLYKCEEQLIKNGFSDCIKLKKRAFKIEL